MIKFIISFFALLFTSLFINMKVTRIAMLFAFKECEDFKSTCLTLLVMCLSAFFWAIFIAIN